MTPLDRLLQRLRVRVAAPHIPPGSRLLDVGCADGHLLRAVKGRIREGVGVDPDAQPRTEQSYRLIRGGFPDGLDDPGPFDVITMLAVFEHFTEEDRPRVVEACRRLLRPGGRVVITVPAAAVDRIVDVLRQLRLVHGMDIEAHHGYDPAQTPKHFSGFSVLRHEPFELGLNHLFVLQR